MGTWTINPDDLTATRAGLGVAIGTDVLAPNGSAASLTGIPADLSGDLRNVALGSAADRITLLNGIVDPLTDETDVKVASLIVITGGSNVGDMTAGGGLAAGFDGTTSQAASASATGANDTGTSFLGKDWGSGVSKKIEKYELYSPSDGGFDPDTGGSTITIKLVGSDSTPSIGSGTQLHTDSFSDATGLTKTYTSGITKTTAYRFHWVEVATNTTNSGQKHGRLAELKLYGADPSGSSNETFTSGSGGYYRGSATLGAAISQGAGTAIGNATANGGLAASFDGTTSQAAAAASKYAASSPTDPLLIGKNHGTGVTKTIAGITVVGSSDQGFQQSVSGSITIKLQGSTDNFSSSVVDLGTETFTDSAGKTLTKTSGFTATAFQYHRIHVTAGSGGGSQSFYVAECTFFEETASNMTLISNPYTATSAPSKTILGFQTVENEAITINTDLKGFVSRDGGSNYTEVTLALKTTLGQTGTKYYECAETTISSTSGSSMVWKITTHNTKDVEVHGVALSWS